MSKIAQVAQVLDDAARNAQHRDLVILAHNGPLGLGDQTPLLEQAGVLPTARAEELDAWKRDRTRGYNLVARRNAESWREVLG